MLNYSELLHDTIAKIQPMIREFHARAQLSLDGLTKPVGSLGGLEELAAHYVAISQKLPPLMTEHLSGLEGCSFGLPSVRISYS